MQHMYRQLLLVLGMATPTLLAEQPEIWQPSRPIPRAQDLDGLDGVRFRVIKPWVPQQDGYRWLHGVALAWHQGSLYASFGHNTGAENTLTEEARYCVSRDGGATWTAPRAIDVGKEAENLAVSHGVFLSHRETLWAFLGAFYDTRKRVHTRAYTFNEEKQAWEPQGAVIEGGFWPMTEPRRMENGDWCMAGLVVGKGNPAGVAISDGENFTTWRFVPISRDKTLGQTWGESTIWVDGPRLTNIARYGAKAHALVASSLDYGRTWTASVDSGFPMVTSKPYSGTLSNGQRYLICTTTSDSGARRFPLTIAVGKPGAERLSHIFRIRRAIDPASKGESHPRAALSYPYAVEHEGKLWIGYSNSGGRGGNQNSAELAIVPMESLAVD